MPFGNVQDGLEPEYKPDFDLWKRNPNPATTGTLLRTVQPSIDRAMSAHVRDPNPILRSRARRMALQAIKTYDPARGVKLNTHIVNQLQGLKRVARQQNQIIKIPERAGLDQARLSESNQQLSDELGREPTSIELADHTGLSLKRLQYLRGIQSPMAAGQLSRMTDEGMSDFSPAVRQPESRAWAELIYQDLDPVNQKILEHSLGLHGAEPLTNRDLAARINLTPGAVSQRKAVIQSKLDEGFEINPLSRIV